MNIDVEERAAESNVERRLRDAYATMVPLLAESPTVTDSVPVEPSPDDLWVGPAPDGGAHRGRLGLRLVAAAAAAVLVVVGLAAVRRAGNDDRSVDAPSPTVDRSTAQPEWYTDLRGLLPDDVDRIALTQASDVNVEFVAFRSASPEVLDIQISLDPLYGAGAKPDVPGDAPSDEVGTYLEAPGEVRLVTPDDRFVIVRCGLTPFATAARPLGPATSADPCAPDGQTAGIDGDGLRQIARDLATGYPTELRAAPIVARDLSESIRAASESQVFVKSSGAAIGDDALGSVRRLDLLVDPTADVAEVETTITIFANVVEPITAGDPPRARFVDVAGVRTAFVTSEGYGFHVVTSTDDIAELDELSRFLDRLIDAASSGSTTPVGIDVEVATPVDTIAGPCPGDGDADGGCLPYLELPVADGASDFYVGPDSLGTPVAQLGWFDSLVRCTTLDAAGSACTELEGIAGVGLVGYGPGDPAVDDDADIEIGTTFTRLSAADYADEWRQPVESVGTERSTETVRGHEAEFFEYFADRYVVWNERPGVLVWVKVPVAARAELAAIAEGVRRVPGPATIPWKVVVADDLTGWRFDARSNDGRNLLVGRRADGLVCVGFGYIDGGCSTDIADRTFTRRADDPGRVLVTGTAPDEVGVVRLLLADGSSIDVETRPVRFADGRFFSAFVDIEGPATVEWLQDGTVVASTEIDVDFCLTACG